jgi:hypothetical protein
MITAKDKEIAKQCADRMLGKGVSFQIGRKHSDFSNAQPYYNVYYDINRLSEIIESIGKQQYITFFTADNKRHKFYGFIEEFNPVMTIEGECQSADIKVIKTRHLEDGNASD